MDQPCPEQKPVPPIWVWPACGIVGIFLAGITTGVIIQRTIHTAGHGQPDRETHLRSSYHYINPILECNQSRENGLLEFRPSERAVQSLIEQYQKSGDAQTVAVYFRDLNNGPWFGIQEELPFGPASMLKTAHAIAVYKRAEEDRGLLQKKLLYPRRLSEDVQFIKPEEPLVPGTSYTVEELVRHMIVDSDNEALALIQKELTTQPVKDVYTDLGIEFDQNEEISARSYSTLLRVLFNASYLNKQDSEYLLSLLTQTVYNDGLRAGVPESIPVAHKFGERALRNPYNQLHDCGIVYYPDHPYLLCVMTRGISYEKLSHVIASISDTVYQQIRLHYQTEYRTKTRAH